MSEGLTAGSQPTVEREAKDEGMRMGGGREVRGGWAVRREEGREGVKFANKPSKVLTASGALETVQSSK